MKKPEKNMPNKRFIYEQRYKIVFWMGVIFALNAMFAFLFTYPEAKKSARADRLYDSLSRESDSLKKELIETRELLELIKSNGEGVTEFYENTLAGKKERMTPLQRLIREIARESGIFIDQINYSTRQDSDSDLVSFGIDLPLIGDYESVRAFINRIENSDYFLIIENVLLRNNKDKAQLSFKIGIVTYFESEAINWTDRK